MAIGDFEVLLFSGLVGARCFSLPPGVAMPQGLIAAGDLLYPLYFGVWIYLDNIVFWHFFCLLFVFILVNDVYSFVFTLLVVLFLSERGCGD